MGENNNQDKRVRNSVCVFAVAHYFGRVDFKTTDYIITATTPATPLHGSAPGGLLFCGAGK